MGKEGQYREWDREGETYKDREKRVIEKFLERERELWDKNEREKER